MLVKHVTLCLLITYHWAGSEAAGLEVAAGGGGFWSLPEAGMAGIAVEVNGSPTDARLNIPVVKRSSNQAEFANELRGSLEGAKRRAGDDAGGFLGLPHEYPNRDEEKYSVEGSAVRERESKERGKLVGIKASIPGTKEVELIGRVNSTEGTLRLDSYYDGTSTVARLNDERGERAIEADLDDVANVAKKKIILVKEEVNNRRNGIIPVFASALRRIRRDAAKRTIRNSVDSTTGTIDSELEKQRKQQQEDYDASRVSQHRLSALSSLKLTEQGTPERYKLTGSAENHKQIFHSRRLHQQSRNTKPRTIIQHLRRNTKRQAFDDNSFSRSEAFLGNRNQEIPNLASSTGDSQLRFIPASHHRADNRVYFQRFLKPLPPSRGFQGNDDSPFIEDSEANPQGIPRFNDDQLEKLKNSIKGVFDKYEARQQGQIDLLPNVRMIQSKQIFVARPRVIYDTKILPAPDSYKSYFEETSSNSNTDNRAKVMDVGFATKGVFDQSHEKSELDQRDVIPVREDSAPSLTSTGNFVTPLPPYRVDGGGGGTTSSQHQVSVNQPAEDSNLQEQIYRVREEELGIPGMVNESQRDDNDERNEDSLPDHESPIDVGTVDHFGDPGLGTVGGGGSSYDNLESTSPNQQHESGSTNVDHSNAVEGTIDEYVNRSPTIRIRTSTSPKSNGNAYDRGNYKWRQDDHHDRYAANYSFGYRVSDYETENEFGHQETRKEGITMGKYHVRLPDGRIQKVNYHVDDGGYHASVSYHRDDAE